MLVLSRLQIILQSQIFAVQILENNVLVHLLGELLVSQASELNEWADIVPVFLVVLSVCLAHAGQLIRYLLCNVIGNLLHKAVVLKSASGYV